MPVSTAKKRIVKDVSLKQRLLAPHAVMSLTPKRTCAKKQSMGNIAESDYKIVGTGSVGPSKSLRKKEAASSIYETLTLGTWADTKSHL